MTQYYPSLPIDPLTTDGNELADILSQTLGAMRTMHSGAARPSYAVAGTLWLDTAITGLARLKFFDGADDIVLAAFDTGVNRYRGLPRGHISGLHLSNNAADPTNDIDIAGGQCRERGGHDDLVLQSTLTKRIDAAWAVGSGNGGMDTGSVADGNTYHVHLIKREDTQVVDALFSTSVDSPTMPTNYTYNRRIGSVLRLAGAIKKFQQVNDLFTWETPVQDLSLANPPTTAVTSALTVPSGGLSVLAHLAVGGSNGSVPTGFTGIISSLDMADIAPSGSIWNFANSVAAANSVVVMPVDVKTNTSAQFRRRVSATSASTTMIIETLGWTDDRGRNL